jgi:sigma-B regulation protein RsbU (phosphoserine phosphatase)
MFNQGNNRLNTTEHQRFSGKTSWGHASIAGAAELALSLQGDTASQQPHQPIRQLVRHMWLRYLIAAALIGGLAVTSYLVVINLNLLNENSGHLVQTSARQLTLAEHIGRLSLRLTLPLADGERSAIQDDLHQAIDELATQYAALRDGKIEGSLTPGAAAIFSGAPHGLNIRFPAFRDLALHLADEVEFIGSDALAADAERVSAAVNDLTPGLRALIKTYEENSVEKIYEVIETETYVALVTLLVLLLEILLIFRPIIGRVRRTALLLQQQAAFNQNILATTQAFVVGLDRHGRIVIFNHYSESQTGWPYRKVAGADFAERFLPAGHRAAFAALSAELFADRRQGEYEAPCATRTGKTLIMHWHLTAVRDPADGRPLLLLATGVDLTDIRASAARLEAALHEARTLGERLREEVSHAALLQRSLLPAPEVNLPGVKGVAILTTCTEVGGDYYDYYGVDGRYAVVIVADASGHGVAAGTLVGSAKIAVQQMSDRGEIDPARILTFINHALIASTHESMFMTMGCLCLDSATGLLRYASAGHVFPYLYRRSSGGWHALETSGVPLGRVADAEYRSVTIDMAVGDRLFLYTDGLVEERTPKGDMFGFERLERLLEEYGEMSCDEAAYWMHNALEQHRGSPALSDDVTLLVLDYVHRTESYEEIAPVSTPAAGGAPVRLTDAAYRLGGAAPEAHVSRQCLVFLAQRTFADLLPRFCRDGIRRVLPEDAMATRTLGLPKLLAQHHTAAAEDLYRLVGKCTVQRQFPLSHSDEKAFVGMEIAALLDSQPEVSAEHAETVLLVVDELIENALYGAPRDPAGRPLYAKAASRNIAAFEGIRLDLALNEEWLGVMITDLWGTLTPAVFLRRLALNNRLQGLQAGAGGAGLFLAWHLSDYCQIRVFPRRRTQVTVLWQLSHAPDPDTAPGFQFLYHVETDESCRLDEGSGALPLADVAGASF